MVQSSISVIVAACIAAVVCPCVYGQNVIYDLPAIGGNVFPGQDGRLTADDAQFGGSDRVAETLTIPVAALGNGTVDVTASLYEDSGTGPGRLLWQSTSFAEAFSAPAGSGDFRDLTWTMINTPVPDNAYWGIRFSNVSPGIPIIGTREGDVATLSPAGATTSTDTLYVQAAGGGAFEEYNFYAGGNEVNDSLAVRITASSLAVVPEPRVLGMFLAGGLIILLLRRRQKTHLE